MNTTCGQWPGQNGVLAGGSVFCDQSPVYMGIGARLARSQFAVLAGGCTASWTAGSKYVGSRLRCPPQGNIDHSYRGGYEA